VPVEPHDDQILDGAEELLSSDGSSASASPESTLSLLWQEPNMAGSGPSYFDQMTFEDSASDAEFFDETIEAYDGQPVAQTLEADLLPVRSTTEPLPCLL
jgi:hypothetical protein